MRKYNYDLERVKAAVANNITIKGVMIELGIPVRGGNHRTIRRKIKEYNISTSHFDPYRSASKTEYVPAEFYLKSDKKIPSHRLLSKLVKEGYKEYKCEICGITNWNGERITLQLHHIDGNDANNTIENLQVVCPNCHSQTHNFKGKANKKEKPKIYCKVCGKQLRTNARTGMCNVCYRKIQHKPKKPSKEELYRIFEGLNNNYSATGRYFNVSDNCIRKWMKGFNS
jgi:Zn finger protein HypA/HybF involved in hydrogenase expression